MLDATGHVVGRITRATLPDVLPALGGSRGTDVTGGMAAKVMAVLDLAAALPGLRVRIFSGLEAGVLTRLLLEPETPVGTELG